MEPKCGEGTCLFWGGQSWYHLPLPVRCLHKFFSREAEKRQVLSSPRLSLAKYWFEYRSRAQRDSLLLQIYVFLKPGRVGVIEAKYGSNMETGDGVFISLPATRDCKKPLFNQALPLLGEGEQVWWKWRMTRNQMFMKHFILQIFSPNCIAGPSKAFKTWNSIQMNSKLRSSPNAETASGCHWLMVMVVRVLVC